jgi:hypothetical protein
VKPALVLAAIMLSSGVLGQDRTESREMIGHVGSRGALLVLHATQMPDGGWQMAGEYLILPTLVRRYLEGERGPELGATTLKEGTSAILFGRPPSGELRGTLRDGVFKGTRFGPGGQERERFEFTENFPAMDGYSAKVRCDAGDERYASTLEYAVDAGKLKALEWRSRVAASGHQCVVRAGGQQPIKGGLRVVAGNCAITLRDLGEQVKVSAENCASLCGSEGYLETLLVDKRGHCRLLRPER